MAIYRLEAKIVTRGKGHSAVAAAAYRTGTKIKDERTGKTHDYSSRTKGIVESVILRPEHSPEWSAQTATLWNTVEQSEKRKDARLSREFVLAVPKELDADQQMALATGWAQKELVGKGMVAEVSLHHPKGGKNPHVHILTTLRTIEGETFSAKKPREWNEKAQLHDWRESWCHAENAALEKAGRPERVDHRSLKDRGIDRIPEPKIGKEAMGLKKRGVVADPERFQFWRKVKMLNETRPWARAIERLGEVQQQGMGATWWERSLVMTKEVGRTVRDAIRDTWAELIRSKMAGQDLSGPAPDRDQGMDMSR